MDEKFRFTVVLGKVKLKLMFFKSGQQMFFLLEKQRDFCTLKSSCFFVTAQVVFFSPPAVHKAAKIKWRRGKK